MPYAYDHDGSDSGFDDDVDTVWYTMNDHDGSDSGFDVCVHSVVYDHDGSDSGFDDNVDTVSLCGI